MGSLLFSFLFSPIGPFRPRNEALGWTRRNKPIENLHGEDLHVIPDTQFMEDMAYHAPSGYLFGASEADTNTRFNWFPPLAAYTDVGKVGRGSIVAIDTKTLRCTRLKLNGFEGKYNTHGMDILSTDSDPTTVYIVGINHLPNPAFYRVSPQPDPSEVPRARSRLEVFKHKIGTGEATHVRSIWHPAIRTPNDVLFKSLSEIHFTNDHYYREGFMRFVEDFNYMPFAGWTDIGHLKLDVPLDKLEPGSITDDSAGVTGGIAIKGIHNNNGLGRGRTPSEIATCRTFVGECLLLERDPAPGLGKLHITDRFRLPSSLDNPVWFQDPYAAETGRDASGWVLAGMAHAITFPDGLDPPVVWLVQNENAKKGGKAKWAHRAIFRDDGHILRCAATALLVAIEPAKNEGKKQAQLWVTSPIGKGLVVSNIDL